MKQFLTSGLLGILLILTLVNSYFLLNLYSSTDKIDRIYRLLFYQQKPPEVPPEVNWKDSCSEGIENYDAIFFFWEQCPYCKSMVPYVNSSVIKFYWFNVADTECTEKIKPESYGFTGAVPYFVCLRKPNHTHLGIFLSREDFDRWSSECVR